MNSSAEASKLELLLQELQEQLRQGAPEFESFQRTYRLLTNMTDQFRHLLEWATEEQRGQRQEANFYRLYCQMAAQSASELLDRLKRYGYALRQDSGLKDAFENQGYRLMQLIRAGKREEVFYSLLRIFVANRREMQLLMIEPFKPVYPDNLFKIFLFAFLSGVLGQEGAE